MPVGPDWPVEESRGEAAPFFLTGSFSSPLSLLSFSLSLSLFLSVRRSFRTRRGVSFRGKPSVSKGIRRAFLVLTWCVARFSFFSFLPLLFFFILDAFAKRRARNV